MSSTEIESQRMSSMAVATRRFGTARHGYEPEEVHAFLEAVAQHIRELEGELRQQHARMALLERRAAAATDTAYARVFRQLMGVVRAAEQAGDQIRASAEEEARAIVASARGREASPAAENSPQEADPSPDPDDDLSIDVELLWGKASS